jgi:ectoine utilization protein EutC
MRDILVLTVAELRKIVQLDLDAVAVVENAFRLLAAGKVIMPPILSMEIPAVHGEVDVKTAYIPGFEGFAIKVSPGFFNNPKLGLPSLNGLMILFSASTGLVQALLLDNGYLTDVRTAAAGAVAARHLAPKTVETAGVMGAGLQARLQIEAAYLVRPFTRVLVWSRDPGKGEACAADITRKIGVPASAASAETTVRESQLVITATPARDPILRAEWLHPRLHITAMGADQAGKNEIEPQVIGKADLYVCDRVSQAEKLGELRSARALGFLNGVMPPELGEIIDARKGRRSDDEITICDLTGTGAQDTAIANHALNLAREMYLGTIVKS